MGVLTFQPHATVTHDESTRAVMGYWADATKELESGAQLPQDRGGTMVGRGGCFGPERSFPFSFIFIVSSCLFYFKFLTFQFNLL
jgi:hypothetical protein